jgi:hypothetical protein
MRSFLAALLVISTPALAVEPAKPVAAPAVKEAFSVTATAIGDLLDDPAAKAILDKRIPGMTENPQVDMARALSLKDLQQFAADQVTDEVLAQIEADFKALAASK